MANTFFSFKQFTIHQEQCAMKVSTDACLFGAYIAHFLETNSIATSAVLDIGAGTGLLSLMLAQKNPKAQYTAIEFDVFAASQASENILKSPWKEQMTVINEDVLIWSQNAKSLYDLIVCNPPFFSQHLLSDKQERIMARHDEFLTLENIEQLAFKHLMNDGIIALLLPYSRKEECNQLFQGRFHLVQLLETSDNSKKPFNRVVCCYSKNPTICTLNATQMVLHDSAGRRSDQWQTLIQDYYLH